MRHRNRRRLVRYAIGTAVVLVYAAVLFLFVRNNGSDVDSPDAGAGASSGAPSSAPTTPSGTTSRTGITELPTDIAPATGAPRTLAPAIPGGIVRGSVPSHKVVLTATSRAAIVRLGYLVPTSFDNPIGDIRGVGTSWSVTTTAYGDPAYAEIFIQAGRDGVPITCTITVDGKVTNSETTSGAYGRQVCIG